MRTRVLAPGAQVRIMNYDNNTKKYLVEGRATLCCRAEPAQEAQAEHYTGARDHWELWHLRQIGSSLDVYRWVAPDDMLPLAANSSPVPKQGKQE